jgi:uncharacterized protein
MLLIRTRLDRSSIHGFGVFAVESVPKGTEVWRFSPGFDLEREVAVVEAQPAHVRGYFSKYGYIDRRLKRYILCIDDARHLNHSDTPNLRCDYALDRYGVDIAARDIAAGEELTVDYQEIEGQRPTHDSHA